MRKLFRIALCSPIAFHYEIRCWGSLVEVVIAHFSPSFSVKAHIVPDFLGQERFCRRGRDPQDKTPKPGDKTPRPRRQNPPCPKTQKNTFRGSPGVAGGRQGSGN